MKYIVTENKAHAVIANKIFSDDERLGESVRARLFGIGEPDSVVTAITKQAPKPGEVLRSGIISMSLIPASIRVDIG